MRRAPAGQALASGYQNGTILQVFSGTPTVSDVTFNSSTPASTGYPANSPFVKLRAESLLRIIVNCDITGASSPPDTVWIDLFVDGSALENAGHGTSGVGGDLSTWQIILDGVKWAKGSHTVEIKPWDTQSKSNTIRCSTSCDFTIIEYV